MRSTTRFSTTLRCTSILDARAVPLATVSRTIGATKAGEAPTATSATELASSLRIPSWQAGSSAEVLAPAWLNHTNKYVHSSRTKSPRLLLSSLSASRSLSYPSVIHLVPTHAYMAQLNLTNEYRIHPLQRVKRNHNSMADSASAPDISP